MAKSTNFFGLRRGSTKAHTFQVYRGMQITKDRVTAVSNPQSDAQMQQRLKLPIVSQARSTLRDLVNHSWEGITYGETSLKKFSEVNLAKGSLNITAYVPKNIMDTGISDLQISDGSLTTAYQFESVNQTTPDEELDKLPCQIDFSLDTTLENPYTLASAYAKGAAIDDEIIEYIKKAFNLEDNDQLTFLIQRQGDEYTWADSDGNEYVGNYHRFTISRLIMNKDKATQWKVYQATEANSSVLKLTDGYMVLRIVTNETADTYISVGLADLGLNSKIVAATSVFSRQVDNVWRRSKAKLIIASNLPATIPSTMDYNTVVTTYLKASTISNRYLNTGTEGVGITGGN